MLIDLAMAAKFIELAVGLGFGAVITNLINYALKKRDAQTPAAVESTELAITEKALIAAGIQLENLLKDNDRLRLQLAQEREHYIAEINRLEVSLIKALAELNDLKRQIPTN